MQQVKRIRGSRVVGQTTRRSVKSSYQVRMQQQREGCSRASKLQELQEVRDPLRPTVVQWEIAVAEWPRGSNFRERVGNEYVIGATQSFTTTDG